jgi:hypothetical protein
VGGEGEDQFLTNWRLRQIEEQDNTVLLGRHIKVWALDVMKGFEGLRHCSRDAAVHQVNSSLAIGTVKRCILDIRIVLYTFLDYMV